MFDDNFLQFLGQKPQQPSWATSMLIPRTSEDPNFSPIVDAEYVHLGCIGHSSHNSGNCSDDECNTTASHTSSSTNSTAMTTTLALLVVHRIAYRAGEEVILGRVLIPTKRGLCEIVVAGGDTATGWRESSIVAAKCREDPKISTPDLDVFAKSHDYDSEYYDRMFPSHCLSRVRTALSWLLHSAGLQVTEPSPYVKMNKRHGNEIVVPASSPRGNKHYIQLDSNDDEVELPSLQCCVIPPPRFLHCPDQENPHSDKQRFCRVSFGGTIGVEVMVVSRWKYFYSSPRSSIESFKQVAKDGATLIHRSQSYEDIQVDLEVLSFASPRDGPNCDSPRSKSSPPTSPSSSWFGNGRTNKRVSNQNNDKNRRKTTKIVLTWVECYDPKQEKPFQHVIGWIKELKSGSIFLIYLTDIMGRDRDQIRDELCDSLRAIRPIPTKSKSLGSSSRKVVTNHRLQPQRKVIHREERINTTIQAISASSRGSKSGSKSGKLPPKHIVTRHTKRVGQ